MWSTPEPLSAATEAYGEELCGAPFASRPAAAALAPLRAQLLQLAVGALLRASEPRTSLALASPQPVLAPVLALSMSCEDGAIVADAISASSRS